MRSLFQLRAGVAVLLIAATAIAGCTSASPQPSASSTGDIQASGNLRLWVGSWWEPDVPAIVERWEKDHPEITLEILPTPNNGYVEAFTAATLGGDPPDIIDLSSRAISTVVAQDLLQPIDDVKAKIDSSDYGSGMWIASTYNGVTYTIPSRASAMVLFYNKTMFDKAGVGYPTDDWNYDDLVQVAKDLTSGDQYGIGMGTDLSDPGAAMNLFLPLIWGHGGDVLTEDFSAAATTTPEFIEGLTYFTDFYTKYKVAPEGTPNFNVPRDLIPMFQANKLAIFASDGSGRTALEPTPEVEYGMVLLPNKVGKATGWAMGIPAGAKNPDAAKVFLEWWADPTIQGELSPVPPARVGALSYPKWNDPLNEIFIRAGENARPDPGSPYWNAIAIAVLTEVQKVLVGDLTPAEAGATMEKAINDIIKRGGQ